MKTQNETIAMILVSLIFQQNTMQVFLFYTSNTFFVCQEILAMNTWEYLL